MRWTSLARLGRGVRIGPLLAPITRRGGGGGRDFQFFVPYIFLGVRGKGGVPSLVVLLKTSLATLLNNLLEDVANTEKGEYNLNTVN